MRSVDDHTPSPPPSPRDTRPISVRDVLRENEPPQPEVTLPGRTFSWKGESWWVQELGHSRIGRRDDQRARILLLGFRRDGDPEGEFSLEAMVRGDGVNALSEIQLEEAAGAAVPFRALPGNGASPQPGSRRDRGEPRTPRRGSPPRRGPGR